jgi:hypothetical protein
MSEEEENINPNEEEEGKPAAAASPLSAASAASAFVDDEELEASVTLENLSDEEAASLLSSAQQSSSDVKNGEVSRSSRSYASWEYDDFCFDSSEDDDNADQTSPTPAAGGRLVVLFSRHAPQLGLGPFGRKRSMVSILHDREV